MIHMHYGDERHFFSSNSASQMSDSSVLSCQARRRPSRERAAAPFASLGGGDERPDAALLEVEEPDLAALTSEDPAAVREEVERAGVARRDPPVGAVLEAVDGAAHRVGRRRV